MKAQQKAAEKLYAGAGAPGGDGTAGPEAGGGRRAPGRPTT